MLLSMYVEGSDLSDVEKPITAAISQWLQATKSVATFIDETNDSGERSLGIQLRIRKKGEMKAALQKLYEIAKQNKREFVIGIVDEKSGCSEEVCFFGHEEGKPDVFEIANYLGLH